MLKSMWCLFFFFFGFLVEWVDYNHGKAASWPRFLALLRTSCMIQDKRHGFNPTLIMEQDLGRERFKGLSRASAFSFFHQIRRLCSRQRLRLMCHCLSPLRSGYKKSFSSRPTLTFVNTGISRDSWSWKQGRGLGECDKVWKWIRFWYKCPKVLGNLQGPEATEENQNTHVGSM